MTKRIGIHVVAYNAADTLAHVLDRIPRDFAARIDRLATKVWPTMFGYQMLFELRSTANAVGTPRP